MIHRVFHILFVLALVVSMILVGGLKSPKQETYNKNIEVFTNPTSVAGGTVISQNWGGVPTASSVPVGSDTTTVNTKSVGGTTTVESK